MDKIEITWLSLKDKLNSFILSKVPDKAVAEDILQEVFIKLHSKIDTLRDDTKFQPWIYQITRNLIADYFRNLKRENFQNHYIPVLEEEDPGNELMAETLSDMIKMMDDMPAEYCEALCMTELEGLSQKEYAQKIGISYSGAKSRVQRARSLLKDMLMNCCHYQFDVYGTVLSNSPNNCCCCNPGKHS